MRQTDPNNPDGLWALAISGSVNLAGGGGAGGTSMVDDNPFTPGGTSITPAGGYYGGRQIGSGNAAAPALSGSAILQVHVVAGGAGGGLSQLQVVGSDNTNFNNVGYPSGGSPTFNSVPVIVMNQAAAGGGFASVAVFGSPGMPVYTVGSTNIVNPVGILGLAGSVQITGSVNPHGVFAPAGSINVVGSVSATQLGAPWSFVGSMAATNLGGSVGVTQIGAPWSVVGSAGITGLGGSIGAVNLGGSVGVTQLGAPWSVVGSVDVTPLASFSLGGVPMVDIRGSLTATQWIISGAASGQFVVAGSAPASQRIRFSSYHLVSTGTVDLAWQSPSGVWLTGSMRLLPGAGFGLAGAFPNGPILIGSQQSAVYIHSSGTQNIGGIAVGWIE